MSLGGAKYVTADLESPNDLHSYHITDGNYGGGKSHHLEVWTRYPESVPYIGDSVDAWSTEEETRI